MHNRYQYLLNLEISIQTESTGLSSTMKSGTTLLRLPIFCIQIEELLQRGYSICGIINYLFILYVHTINSDIIDIIKKRSFLHLIAALTWAHGWDI